jgi:TonB family protein
VGWILGSEVGNFLPGDLRRFRGKRARISVRGILRSLTPPLRLATFLALVGAAIGLMASACAEGAVATATPVSAAVPAPLPVPSPLVAESAPAPSTTPAPVAPAPSEAPAPVAKLELTPEQVQYLKDLAGDAGPAAEQHKREQQRAREHRARYGAWKSSSTSRWRGALDGYVVSARPDLQRPLNDARMDFARYLNTMHNRIHPLFGEWFLGSLASLPATSPLNAQMLATTLEIVLSPDGRIARMGVIRGSGVVDFDVAALDAVDRSQPFPSVPTSLRSTDGNAYVSWTFKRDEVYACSTMKAQPYLLAISLGPSGS